MYEIIIGQLTATIRILTPLALAALGELIVERSGVLNLSIEGIMLFGAFVGFIATYYTNDPWIGILSAMGIGILLALIFGVLTVLLALDQIIVGLSMNILAMGATFFFYRAIFGWYVSPVPPHVKTLIREVPIPGLSMIPIIGQALFNQTVFTYLLLFVLIPLTYFVLYKTRIGLHLRACGEDPLVADYLGINVYKYRFMALVVEGILGGIAGALLSISQYNMFLDNMTAGRGYIAVALVILGRWDPLRMLLGAILYAFVDAFQLRIQAAGVIVTAWFPYQFALMLPYVVALIALILFGRRIRGPRSLAKPYRRVK